MTTCPICQNEFENIYVHLENVLNSGCTQHEQAVRELFAATDEMLLANKDIYDIQTALQSMNFNMSFLATDGLFYYRKKFLNEKLISNLSEWDVPQLVNVLWKGVSYRFIIADLIKRVVFHQDPVSIPDYILDKLNQGQHPVCKICNVEHGVTHSFKETFLPSDIAYVCSDCSSLLKGPKISVSRQFHFAAAHYLPEYNGKCVNLHGHEWKVELSFERAVNLKTNMVIDYTDIKTLALSSIDSMFDHGKVNSIIAFPTAENILLFVWERLMFDFNAKNISRIRIWESHNSYADLTSSNMADYIIQS